VRAITFAVIDRLNVVDIAAWQPRTGELASWRGQAFCLGDLDDLFNPAIYFAGGTLPIHASPLEWLRASRDGIVIMRPELTYSYLRNVQRLAFSDAALAGLVRTRLRPPRPRVDLLIEVPADDRRAV
jgi:hypothetical protein